MSLDRVFWLEKWSLGASEDGQIYQRAALWASSLNNIITEQSLPQRSRKLMMIVVERDVTWFWSLQYKIKMNCMIIWHSQITLNNSCINFICTAIGSRIIAHCYYTTLSYHIILSIATYAGIYRHVSGPCGTT